MMYKDNDFDRYQKLKDEIFKDKTVKNPCSEINFDITSAYPSAIRVETEFKILHHKGTGSVKSVWIRETKQYYLVNELHKLSLRLQIEILNYFMPESFDNIFVNTTTYQAIHKGVSQQARLAVL